MAVNVRAMLGRKLGPMPVGGWILLVGGGIAGAYWIRRRGLSDTEETPEGPEAGDSLFGMESGETYPVVGTPGTYDYPDDTYNDFPSTPVVTNSSKCARLTGQRKELRRRLRTLQAQLRNAKTNARRRFLRQQIAQTKARLATVTHQRNEACA